MMACCISLPMQAPEPTCGKVTAQRPVQCSALTLTTQKCTIRVDLQGSPVITTPCILPEITKILTGASAQRSYGKVMALPKAPQYCSRIQVTPTTICEASLFFRV